MRVHLLLLAISCSACSAGQTVIPIKVQYGNPIATAVINNQEVRLMVDTGGLALGLREEAVTRLGIETSSETTTTTDIEGQIKETNVLTVLSINFGGSEFSDLEAFEWQIPPPIANRNAAPDGILGREFLNRFLAVYDYPGETITLYSDTRHWPKKCDGVEFPIIDHPERIISTTVIVDDGAVNAIWDTGATNSFIKAHVADERKFPLVPDENKNLIYNTDQFVVGDIDLGPIDFVALPFTEPANIDIYVGRNFFEKHVICINMVENKVRIPLEN